jgi:hypothetical protein
VFFLLRNRAMLVVCCLLMPAFATGQTLNDDQWKNVLRAQKSQKFKYSTITRDLGCVEGTILSVTQQSVSLNPKGGTTVMIPKKDVLRFSYPKWGASGILYSGRNSWLDVREIPHNSFHGEAVRVVMHDGSLHQGRLLDVLDSSLTVLEGRDRQQKQTRIAKGDLAEVYRITYKRMSSGADYIYSELPFFWVLDPATWPAAVDQGTLVLLYRAGYKEENEPLICSHEL